MQYLFPAKTQYHLAQITDCHLLADKHGFYQQVQPARHLAAIVQQLLTEQPDAVLLTGDLTQDHTAASYQLLAHLLMPLQCPVFVTPGNHDDMAMLAALMQQAPFRAERSLVLGNWLIALLNSKGETPAGAFHPQEQQWLTSQLQHSAASDIWLFCHHHPLALNWFIDKHGQQDGRRLWQSILADSRIRGIGHGHAHFAYQLQHQGVNIVGCPASSVQFLATADWQTYDAGPQWCDWLFAADGRVSWQFRQLSG